MELLTTEQMAAADALAVEYGESTFALMNRAGRAVADHASRMVPRASQILVVCGPGNNGGDGFVAARRLHEDGHHVEVVLVGDRASLSPDAAEAASGWAGRIRTSAADLTADLIIDALFGAGLSRPISGAAEEVVAAINASGTPVLSVDVPSGLDANLGQAIGPIVQANTTVTFFRKKPGHLLLPGRTYCGDVVLAQIGIPDQVLDTINPRLYENGPGLWELPVPKRDGHKYDRGHAVIASGPVKATGAARLAARGALRVGAGLVTVASPGSALVVNASHLTAIMIETFESTFGLEKIVEDPRKNALLIGPGFGVGPETRAAVAAFLSTAAAVVLDADALTSFADNPGELFAMIRSRQAATVLTPHEGEFSRLFPGRGSKLRRAREAALTSGAVVLLKGFDTVVAGPLGTAAINGNAPAWTATAGAGDVLAGIISGLLAQGMEAFDAACAGVWLHGEAATAVGPGLIAEDLPDALLAVIGRHVG
ncbi:MAG: NAD(P)H-hydrate dehydratase [Acidimicrobiia bacterium]|nr:NAD(P)H-hydrate dehydratase [Acidimicrobiia bacterium]